MKTFTIPVALHLDHGKSVELCKACVDLGFTSVMLTELLLKVNLAQSLELRMIPLSMINMDTSLTQMMLLNSLVRPELIVLQLLLVLPMVLSNINQDKNQN